ncbi:MAG: restriction endonuclease [Erysipelotrichaceae bacterium]|nr:restriction endonuclease [Erysipelotrichaceae bacterium]
MTKNEITVSNGELVSVIEEQGIDQIIKPLVTEIHLFDTYIAGTSYLKNKEPLKTVQVGDTLILQREDNRFDDMAIVILDSEHRKLGYVPEKDNIVFSRLMDAGKRLTAKVNTIKDLDYFVKISISIYLVDY